MQFTEEDLEILQSFISESSEGIEETEPLLIELEETISKCGHVDSSKIDKIFRTFHSIKGSAGFIGLTITNRTTHHAETLLDLVRKNKIPLIKDHIDIFLELCDFFRGVFNHLRSKATEEGFEERAQELIERLDRMVNETPASAGVEPNSDEQVEIDSHAQKEQRETQGEEPEKIDYSELQELLVTDELIKQYVAETDELLDSLEQELLEIEKNPGNVELADNAFRSLHTLKGNAGFLDYTDIVTITHISENFLELVRSGELELTHSQISILLEIPDKIRNALQNMSSNKKPVIENLDDFIELMTNSFNGHEKEKTIVSPQQKIGLDEVLPQIEKTESQDAKAGPVRSDPEERPKMESVEKAAVSKKSVSNEFIRVDVNKLNELMDLVGEIVIAESMVSQHPDIMEKDLPGFEKSAMHLQKNIRYLQEISTSMRMVPVSGLFRKMIRLVRDLANKSGKKVELSIAGGETDVDRSVIEHISDPLVHIIRNSVDHGLELSDERKQAGKDPVGNVFLEAKRVGGEIWIVIQDDGKGLDREKIIAKAIEKGIITGTGEDLTDQQVSDMIFAPGFSTADKVTDISGRGVGMDVVVRNLESIRGRVEVASKKGEGSTFSLRIPLTTAIVEGMLMRVGHSIYAIPTLDIRESLKIQQSSVTNLFDGQEIVKIRDELLPVLRIHELHNIFDAKTDLNEGLMVVAEKGSKSVCLFVDEIIEQKQLVIKSLPPYMGEVKGVNGCTILGDGNICLILDIANIIKLAETQSELVES